MWLCITPFDLDKHTCLPPTTNLSSLQSGNVLKRKNLYTLINNNSLSLTQEVIHCADILLLRTIIALLSVD